jgi:hypothetical protein
MGDEKLSVYHLKAETVEEAWKASPKAVWLAPHRGRSALWQDQAKKALDMLSRHDPAVLVVVVLTGLKGTAMAGIKPPTPLEVARLIARARLLMPRLPISLGCERPRNKEGTELEKLALRAGITRMAMVRDPRLCFGLPPVFRRPAVPWISTGWPVGSA